MEMNKNVILIHGKIGHGKDTVGEMIAEYLKNSFVVEKVGFAFPLKRMISTLTGVPLVCVNENSYSRPVFDFTREQKQTFLPRWGKTLGTILQEFATEAVRDNFDPDTWIKGSEVIMENSDSDMFMYCDLRFPNELMWGDINKAIKIKVIRPTKDVGKEKGRDHNHISERGLGDDDFDFIIQNSGTLDELEIVCKDVAEKIATFINAPII